MATNEERLKTFLQDIAKKENYASGKIDIKPISSGGDNHTTDLFLVTISEPLKKEIINIFAKAANLNENARKNNPFLARVYETEALFYSELVVNFERIYNKHQVPVEDRLIIPKYYGHVLIPDEEILVLEDLEARGFKNFDRMKTFNWEYAATAVTQLAKFHALGLAFHKENPEEFKKIVSNLIPDFIKDKEMMEPFMQMALETGCESLNSVDKTRLLNYFSSKESNLVMTKIMEDQRMLTHGDFRPSNLMHRRRNGASEIILLDYQTLRMGNPVGDLMLFIFSGSDEEFRRLHYNRLFDHYFNQLSRALQQVNVDVENIYPRKIFDANVVEMRTMGLFFGLAVVGMVTVAPEDASNLDGDLYNMQVKPNQLAQERIAGIVRDFIRWGVL